MTKMIDYKKILKKNTALQKKALEKMFELLKTHNIEKKFKISKEELIMQGKN